MESSVINKLTKWGILLLLTGFFLCADSINQSHHITATKANISAMTIAQIQIGDLILREGVGYESFVVKQLSNSSFSHIGLVIETHPEVKIIHATTDDNPSQPNQVIISSLNEFTHQNLAHKWAIYRLKSLTEQEKQQLRHLTLQQLGKPFIINTRLQPHRYCTTLIADGFPDKIRKNLRWRNIDLPGFKGELLFPNAFIQLYGVEMIANNVQSSP